MQSSERRKLCWNCEGGVSYDAIFCPYCDSDLKRPKNESMESNKDNHYKSLNDSLASLYRPPYLAREDHGYGVPDEKEEEFFDEDLEENADYASSLQSKMMAQESDQEGRFVWALLLLLMGGNLLTLGLLILFFSEAGSLTIEWKSQYWFIYILLSCPLMFVGWKCLTLKRES